MTTPRSRTAVDTYHHGNLRQALLKHAVELAQAGGPDAVVLRDVQRMAGVSNSAAYRHYADRDALLAAVTAYAQTRLADAMVARLNALPQRGPLAKRALGRLRATGQGYIDFALAVLTRVAGMPDGAGEAIFAVGRPAGWIAHAIEEYARATPLRPRAVYTGPGPAQGS